MATAIIGSGNIGSVLARRFVDGGEPVVLASASGTRASVLADELGGLARAASVNEAVAGADVIVLALWLNTLTEFVVEHAAQLARKVVIDPSNPVRIDEHGQMARALPDGESAAAVITGLLPTSAHYAKAFGTLGAGTLERSAHRQPLAVLFYAAADAEAEAAVERLIRLAGFEPLHVGGIAAAERLEAPSGDLTEGALNGEILDLDEARTHVIGVAR